MDQIEKIIQELGPPYEAKIIDSEKVAYRKLDAGYEFEVSKLPRQTCILYVWAINPRELVGIYEDIPTKFLKDALGYFAFRYQNLPSKIRVEREDRTV